LRLFSYAIGPIFLFPYFPPSVWLKWLKLELRLWLELELGLGLELGLVSRLGYH